jgi:cyanophycinase
MSIRSALMTLCLFVMPASVLAVDAPAESVARRAHHDLFVVGDTSLPRASHTETLFALMGGGGRLDAAFRELARAAGHGHVVILRAVADDSFDPDDGDYGRSFLTAWGPVASARTIVFRSREAAYDPEVIAALAAADGIFIAGGDQSNYVRYWKGTPVEAGLNAHVRAHRPIGGSSAGLAILGNYSYTALDGGSLESRIALEDPYGAPVTLDTDFLHAPGLEGVITDTHFSARSRLGRLMTFVTRLDASFPAARVCGIGVDEATALLIDAQGIGRLARGSAGSAWLVLPGRRVPLAAGRPLSVSGVSVVRLDAASRIDVRARRVTHAAERREESVHEGRLVMPSASAAMFSREAVPPDED